MNNLNIKSLHRHLNCVYSDFEEILQRHNQSRNNTFSYVDLV